MSLLRRVIAWTLIITTLSSTISATHHAAAYLAQNTAHAAPAPIVNETVRARANALPGVSPEELRSIFVRGDQDLDADPFLMRRSQSWGTQAQPGQPTLTVQGRRWNLARPMREVLRTDRYAVFAPTGDGYDAEKDRGLFFVSLKDLREAAPLEAPVPVFFFPLPPGTKVNEISITERAEPELVSLFDGVTTYPMPLEDFDTYAGLGRMNLTMAQSIGLSQGDSRRATELAARVQSRIQGGETPQQALANSVGPAEFREFLPSPESTAWNGLVLTGYSDGLRAADGRAIFQERLLQFAATAFGISSAFAGDGGQFVLWFLQNMPDQVAAAKLSNYLVHFTITLGAATLFAVGARYIAFREKYRKLDMIEELHVAYTNGQIDEPKLRRALTEYVKVPADELELTVKVIQASRMEERKPLLKRELLRLGDNFAHTMTVIMQAAGVIFGTSVELGVDRFFPMAGVSETRPLRKFISKMLLFPKRVARQVPVNSKTLAYGTGIFGGVDVAMLYPLLMFAVPGAAHLMDAALGGVIPGMHERVYAAFDDPKSKDDTASLLTNEFVRNVGAYISSGASSFAGDQKEQNSLAVIPMVDDELRRQGLNPRDPANKKLRDQLIEEKEIAREKAMGLPGREEFLFDLLTIIRGSQKLMGIVIPNPKDPGAPIDPRQVIESQNPQLIEAWLNLAIRETRAKVRKDPDDKASKQTLAMLTELQARGAKAAGAPEQRNSRDEFLYDLETMLRNGEGLLSIEQTQDGKAPARPTKYADKDFFGAQRPGVLMAWLDLAIGEARAKAAKNPADKTARQALLLLEELKRQSSWTRGFKKNGEIFKALTQMTLTSDLMDVRSVKYVPDAIRDLGMPEDAVRLATDYYRRAGSASIKGDERYLKGVSTAEGQKDPELWRKAQELAVRDLLLRHAERFAQKTPDEEDQRKLIEEFPTEYQNLLSDYYLLGEAKKKHEQEPFDGPKHSWFAKAQMNGVRKQIDAMADQHGFAKPSAAVPEPSTNRFDAFSKRYADWIDEYSIRMVEGVFKIHPRDAAYQDGSPGLALNVEEMRKAAWAELRTQLKCDDPNSKEQQWLSVMSEQDRAMTLASMHAELFAKSYIKKTLETKDIAATDPSMPGMLQWLRQMPRVAQNKGLTRLLRGLEAVWYDPEARLGLRGALTRYVPAYGDLAMAYDRALMRWLPTILATLPVNKVLWGAQQTIPYMTFFTFMSPSILVPKQMLSRLYRNQQMEPMATVPSGLLYGIIYALLTWQGSIVQMTYQKDVTDFYTDHIADPTSIGVGTVLNKSEELLEAAACRLPFRSPGAGP